MNKPRLNQDGFISIGIALLVITFGALLVLQMGSAFLISNRLHQSQRELMSITQNMERLAVQVKQAYQLGQIDGSCQNFREIRGKSSEVKKRSSDYKRVEVNGAKFCMPKGGLCIETERSHDKVSKQCLSLAGESMDWTKGTASDGDVTAARGSDRGSTNTIVVPNRKTGLWRTCDGPGISCFRLSLCPEGKSNCSRDQAIAFQTIRLGGDDIRNVKIDVPPPANPDLPGGLYRYDDEGRPILELIRQAGPGQDQGKGQRVGELVLGDSYWGKNPNGNTGSNSSRDKRNSSGHSSPNNSRPHSSRK